MNLESSRYGHSVALGICFLSGLLAVFAFEPFALAWVVFPMLSLLFYFWTRAASPKQAFLFGLAFGYGLFGLGVSWVYVSLSTYGGMPVWMGSIAVIGFVGILAFFIGICGYSLVRFLPKPGSHRLLLIPFCWIIFEWIKGWILTGFPWLELGYSQTSTWLFALAPIGGVYFISLIIALISCLLVALIYWPRRGVTITILAMIIVVLYPLNQLEWSENLGEPITVGLVQANIPIESKWLPSRRTEIISRFSSMSHQLHSDSTVDLFVWPETALPLYKQQTDAEFWDSLIPSESALLTGLMDNGGADEFYNAAVLSCAGQQQVYRKRHLVPFGEYLPLRFLFDWVLDYLQLPMSDFSAWTGTQALVCPGNINLSLSICYEDAFGSEWRRYLGDASLLVNISEDAWFGDSFAPHQRLQMAQMRSRELSRPLVRSANTGPSVIIDQYGQVQATTEQFTEQSLAYLVQPQTGDTWYRRFGNWVIVLAFGSIAVTVWRRRVSI